MIHDILVDVVRWEEGLEWEWRVASPLIRPCIEFVGKLMDAPGEFRVARDEADCLARLIIGHLAVFRIGKVDVFADVIARGRRLMRVEPDAENWRLYVRARNDQAEQALDNLQAFATWLGEPMSAFDDVLRWSLPHMTLMAAEWERQNRRGLLDGDPHAIRRQSADRETRLDEDDAEQGGFDFDGPPHPADEEF